MKEKEIDYYKVVRDDIYNSETKIYTYKSIVNIIEYKVNYERGKWTYPREENSKLFVFGQKEDAIKLGKQFPSAFIFACKVLKPKHIPKAWRVSGNFYNWSSFWKEYNEGLYPPGHTKTIGSLGFNVPEGTVLCDAVKLTMLIKEI